MNINKKLTALKAYARQADPNGNGSLSTSELKNSNVPKNAKQLLQSIGAEAGNTTGGRILKNFEKVALRYANDFKKADLDKDGKLSPAERQAARESHDIRTSAAGLAKLQKFLWSDE